ncbi:hypothetical protein NDU88_001996 [Pleurodeles waltl]|uniref:Uncharacterized protein n=1 Tax=Pleurodeles waltl TaxID=8319 RepID=A0AAV7S961_PLEWA|nr:hypothetical protein NDU88_001996 [Pleurodeles waltl]
MRGPGRVMPGQRQSHAGACTRKAELVASQGIPPRSSPDDRGVSVTQGRNQHLVPESFHPFHGSTGNTLVLPNLASLERRGAAAIQARAARLLMLFLKIVNRNSKSKLFFALI